MGVGIWTVSRSIYTRFGWLLIACGIVWSFATLAESGQSLLYSLGRVAGWTIGLFAIYVVLVFPTGTLGTRLNRALMAAASAVFVVLYLPTTAMVHDYPQQTPWALCRDACPANAFQIISHEPSFVAAAVVPIREAATILILAAVIAALVHRTLSASRLRRQTLAPVLVAALIFLAAMGAFLAARRSRPSLPQSTRSVGSTAWRSPSSRSGSWSGSCAGSCSSRRRCDDCRPSRRRTATSPHSPERSERRSRTPRSSPRLGRANEPLDRLRRYADRPRPGSRVRSSGHRGPR